MTRQHYVQGDLVMSHLIAVQSAMFPEGEDFFVRSVRHFADRITDPELKAQVAGFIGQEVTHGREHRELNARLAEMGYPTERVDRFTKIGLRRYEKRLKPETCLAITAALEHFTATFAAGLLADPKCQEVLGTTEVRDMLMWHAMEEWEHKAVAFDVFAAVCGDEKLRIRAFRWISFSFFMSTFIQTTISMAGDRDFWNTPVLVRSLLKPSPFLTKDLGRTLRAYAKPGFHPRDSGSADLLAQWQEELFGADGKLAAHVR